jgi:hypothetical protein
MLRPLKGQGYSPGMALQAQPSLLWVVHIPSSEVWVCVGVNCDRLAIRWQQRSHVGANCFADKVSGYMVSRVEVVAYGYRPPQARPRP